MSIKVNGLTKVYGQQTAVNALTFEAKKGEILGFLGPNGAGKSTTMKMLTGFVSPTSGSAEVAGMDIVKDSLNLRRKVGYLPEHNPLYLDLYVKEYLYFVAGIHKIENKKARVAEIIERTGLGREQNKQIGQLSKGYRQRVGLSQAMIHNPEVLILDEPTAGLDPNQLVEIRKLIKDIGKEKTVIFSTHIMQEVQALCDRVIIINKGNLVANDSIDALITKVRGESIVTVEFFESPQKNVFSGMPGLKRLEECENNNLKFYFDESVDARKDIYERAAASGQTIIGMNKEFSSIEEIFQQLTK